MKTTVIQVEDIFDALDQWEVCEKERNCYRNALEKLAKKGHPTAIYALSRKFKPTPLKRKKSNG